MNSFLITSRKRLAAHEYLAPQSLEIHALRIRSVIIDNPLKNVVGHRFYLDATSSTPSAGQEFFVPDGNYDAESYAETLQRMMNDAVNSVQSDQELQAGTYADTPPMQFEVRYNKSSRKMEFLANVKNTFNRDVYLWFDQEASDYLGHNSEEKFVWARNNRARGRNLRTTAFKVLQNPRYYRVASSNLISFGNSFDDNRKTSTLGVVPINHSNSVTVWENPSDVFYRTKGDEHVSINNVINLEFYLEESLVPLVVTDFAVTFDLLMV